jgi:hypothetical protein
MHGESVSLSGFKKAFQETKAILVPINNYLVTYLKQIKFKITMDGVADCLGRLFQYN